MRHINSGPTVRTQFIIFNLFGDYLPSMQQAAWTSGLLEVLKVLGVRERAARSTLSRMSKRGWMRSQRVGRRSAYALTAKGLSLIEEGSLRLFGPRPDKWDGCWHLVTYSLPQTLRQVRGQLRNRLSWLGYGMLLPGTMVAAFPMREQVLQLLAELGVAPYVHFFTKGNLESAADDQIVARCWDLAAINQRYIDFIQRHEPQYRALLEPRERDAHVPPQQSFVQRFWMTYEFTSIPREDPGLPVELLPAEWKGTEAVNLLNDFRTLVGRPAKKYVKETMSSFPYTDEAMALVAEVNA